MPLPAPGRHIVMATPEHAYDRVRVGDVYVVPLFDGSVSDIVAPVRALGVVSIPYRWFTVMGAVRVGSDRGEAFRVTGTGHGTILVALRATQLAQQCLSCRTVHYFLKSI